MFAARAACVTSSRTSSARLATAMTVPGKQRDSCEQRQPRRAKLTSHALLRSQHDVQVRRLVEREHLPSAIFVVLEAMQAAVVQLHVDAWRIR